MLLTNRIRSLKLLTNSKILLLVVMIVFLSGCTAQSNVNANNGLNVNDFSADPPVAEATDPVRFFIDAENVGGTTARCVTTELFGVDTWRTIDGQPISVFGPIIPTQGLGFNLDFINGIFSGCYRNVELGSVCVNYVRDRGTTLSGFIGSSFLEFSNQFCNSYDSANQRFLLTKFQPELLPPDPNTGRAGQSFIRDWTLRPPVLLERASLVYPVTARTSFFYTTNAHINVQALNKEEFQTRSKIGQPTVFPLAVQNSFAAPIQVLVTRGSNPVVVDPYSLSGPVHFENYRFEFVNTGEGFPLSLDNVAFPGSSGFLVATLAVDGPGVYLSECLGQTGTEVFVGSDVIGSLVKLRADQTVPVGCTIGIDRATWATKPAGTITFTISLWYRYYVDRTVNVMVTGVEGLSGPGIV